MGTAEKNLYKEYQKLLKEKGIKQFNNEQIKEMLIKKGDKHHKEDSPIFIKEG